MIYAEFYGNTSNMISTESESQVMKELDWMHNPDI